MFIQNGSRRDKMISDYFKFALETFEHRRLRTWLTIIGIFIGIAAVVALVSLGQGVQHAVTDIFSTIGTDKLIVTPGGFVGPQSGGMTAAKLTEKDIKAIENTRGVEHAVGILSKLAKVKYRDQTKYSTLFGMPTDKETMDIIKTISFFEIEQGRLLQNGDKYKTTIGKTLSTEVFEKDINIGDNIELDGHTFDVVGIYKKSGGPYDRIIRVPIDAAREIFNEPDAVSMIFVQLKEGASPQEVKKDIEESLREERNVKEGKEDFSVILSEQVVETISSIIGTIELGLAGVAGISLIVGAIGVTNTMYTAVRERRNEIGIMKAIGATDRDVILIFVIESGFLGFVGGVLGVIIGFALGKVVEFFAASSGMMMLQAYVSPELIIFALLFSILIGVFSGALPARAAAKIRPVEAMRK